MKSIMLSLSPYWYYLIGEGIKSIEIRKTVPKAYDWNKTVECYMTKDEKSFALIPKYKQEKYRAHFGKVGMRFVCDSVAEYESEFSTDQDVEQAIYAVDYDEVDGERFSNFLINEPNNHWLLWDSCLSWNEIKAYMGTKPFTVFYGLYISDLKIYDTPKELGEFSRKCVEYGSDNPNCDGCKFFIDGRSYEYDESDCAFAGHPSLTRPPQSWCYVEE